MLKLLELLRSPENGGDPPAPIVENPAPPADPNFEDPALNPLADPAKPADPAPVQEPVPFDISKIKLPEGFTATSEELAPIHALLLDPALSPEQRMENLLSAYSARATVDMKRTTDAWMADQTARLEALKVDPTFGGAAYESNLSIVASVIDKFSPNPAELRKEITTRGLGNSTYLANFLLAIGKATAEGKPLVGDPTSEAPERGASVMYPNQGKG